MPRGKNWLPIVSRQFLTRNYPRPNCLLKCLPNYEETNVQQLTCNIDLSNYFYYLFFSFVLIELKPFVLKGKVLGVKFWKCLKKVWKSVKIMKQFCPLVVALWFFPDKLPLPHKRGHFFLFSKLTPWWRYLRGNWAATIVSRQFLPRGIKMPLRVLWEVTRLFNVRPCLQILVWGVTQGSSASWVAKFKGDKDWGSQHPSPNVKNLCTP